MGRSLVPKYLREYVVELAVGIPHQAAPALDHLVVRHRQPCRNQGAKEGWCHEMRRHECNMSRERM